MAHRVALVGDPHGCWEDISRRVFDLRPEAVVLVGDMHGRNEQRSKAYPKLRDLVLPFQSAGMDVKWIHGNHDADSHDVYESTFDSFGEANFSGRVVDVAGVKMGGLGGVFRGTVWNPHDEAHRVPHFETRAAYVATLPKGHRYRDGVPVKHNTTLFPEDFAALAPQAAEILVTHEAGSVYNNPRSGAFGFAEFDALGAAMGVRAIVHGHHHHSYARKLPCGILCIGLAMAEVSLLDDLLAAGEREGRLAA